MVAVISGNGLGWFNSSLAQTGRAHGGPGGLGQGNHSAMVNIANGNLLLTGNDEQASFNGFSLNFLRTYNSQGESSGSAGRWLFSFETRLQHVPPLASPGGGKEPPPAQGLGRFYRHAADGSVTEYVWDAARGAAYSSNGDGAADFVRSGANNTFEWVDGSTREVQVYDSEGRLTAYVDKSGNRWNIGINGNGSESIQIERGAFGEITALDTYFPGHRAHRVEYTYDNDASGQPSRIATVRTLHLSGGGWDLNGVGHFQTTYTYESPTSDRIVKVSQSDGAEVSFVYDTQGRISQVRRGSGAGAPQAALTYTYDTVNRRTTVTDDAAQSWVYAYDTEYRLTTVTQPAVNGQRAQVQYTYDTRGNVLSIQQGRLNDGNTFVAVEESSFEYDSNDNLRWERDRLGNSVERLYNASNQLTRLTRFLDVDTDGAGPQRPEQGVSTQFVYDDQNRLRFEIDASGSIVRYQVNADGLVTRRTAYISANYTGAVNFASLETWAINMVGPQQIVDYTYDFRGLLAFEEQYSSTQRASIDSGSTLRTFAGASVQASVYMDDAGAKFIAYTYDPQGLLRQVINYRGERRQTAEVMSMSYDGMGRLLTQVDAQGRTTSTVYNDAAGTITTTFANGLRTRNEVRDSHGRVVSVTHADTSANAQGGPRVTQNYYDALGRLRATEDAVGGRSYLFYDQAGRIEAEVDATGTVTRYVRDHAGRVLTATTYAQQVDTRSWIQPNGQFVGVLTLPAPNASLDRVVTSGYDSAGRLSHTIDGEGTRSNFTYDGANQLIGTRTFNDNNNNSEIRRTRNFYDPAGRLIATLDADNFLVEHIYDRAGRMTKTIRYAKAATDPTYVATLGKLRPAIDTQDQITRYYYNGRGERIATLDAELYLTHSLFSETANQLSTLRYAKRVQLAVDDGTTLSALLNHLQTEASTARTETQTRNSAGDLVQSNSAGLLTTYQYNLHGQLERTSELDIDDLNQVVTREQRRRLNGFGQVVAELPASALELPPGAPEAVWDRAIKHRYDARGLRVQTTDAEGNHTWYFHDGEGRLTHELRGQFASVAGTMTRNAAVEVTETAYNAFGEARRSIAYTGLIPLGWPYDYNAARTVVQSLSALPADPNNTQVDYTYDRRGLLRTATDPVLGGIASTRIYDDFGALKQQKLTAAIRGVLSEQVTTYSYNARGMLTGESLAHINGAQSVTLSYDAFGRVKSRIESSNKFTFFEYDRLGRQVSSTRLVHVSTAAEANQSVAHRSEVQTTTYDAFSRVLTETDTKGGDTTYTYEAIGTAVNDLRVSVTTPEGVTLTTHRNHRGSTLKVEDLAGQTTRYYYDLDGRLKRVKAADNSETETRYDSRGLVHEAIDATGRKISFTYDAAGRVLTRTENAQATNASEHLTTRYAYDGQGRQIRVTDASGRLTTYEYWQDGQIKNVVRGDRANPADGLEITSYTYDAQGRQLTVVQGEGATQRTTQYQYDEAGRRVEEIVDPAGLQIRTAYQYDANGNLIAKHNPAYAAGSSTPPGVTRMVYDAANLLVFSIDPTGAVTQYHYDTNGQLTWTRAYATRPTLPTHPAPLTLATMLSAVNTIANAATDVQSNIVRDRDGRERFILNADGSWTQYIYNSLGQRHQTLVVGQPNFTEAERLAIRRGDSLLAGVELDEHLTTRFDAATARRNLVVFDALGRPAYTLTPDGQSIHATVSRTQYDAAGRVIAEVQYGKRLLLTPTLIAADVAAVEAQLFNVGALTADQNRQTHYVYDGAGRLQYTVSETPTRLHSTRQ